MQDFAAPNKERVEVIPMTAVETVAIDKYATKRIPVTKQNDVSLFTLSHKDNTFCKSTKYATILSAQQSILSKNKNSEN